MGKWETNPYRIGKLITKCGMKYSVIKAAKKLKMKKGGVYIASFWNSIDVFDGIHTIAVKVRGKNKIQSYNDDHLYVNGKFKDLFRK